VPTLLSRVEVDPYESLSLEATGYARLFFNSVMVSVRL
jgi:hypothetical protein